MRIKIEKSGINGEGIGYWKQKPIFIPSCLPGEEVEVEMIEEKPQYGHAKLLRVVSESTERVVPVCPHQAECGGCALMIANQAYQRTLKERNLKQSLLKYVGKMDFRKIAPVVKNPIAFGYRNQCKLPVRLEEGQLVTGFYRANSNIFLEVPTCILHDPLIETVKKEILTVLNTYKIDEFRSGEAQGLRTLILRSFNQKVQVTLVTGEMRFEEEIISDLLKIEHLSSLYQSINTDKHTHDPMGDNLIHLGCDKTLEFEFASLKFSLTPKAFFQLNATQAQAMFEKVVSLIGSQKRVADVYCGIGAMSLMMAKKAKEVVGIEWMQEAIDQANLNAKHNGIKHVRFLAGDASKVLIQQQVEAKFDVIVVDPPRAGLDEAMIKTLIKSEVEQIIYVSCNPSTLAKNLSELGAYYELRSITPYDMFTHTPLCENVVDLRLKKKA